MSELTGRVLDPTSPGWEAARHNFRAAVDYSRLVPKNVVFCQHPRDVQNAVRFARENRLPLRARSGRHSYEAFSLADSVQVIFRGRLSERLDPQAAGSHIGELMAGVA